MLGNMMRVERVRMGDWHKGIREIIKQLDRTNVRILSAMWRYGPRNLLEVSRRTRIPFTSVYHRVGKLEAKSKGIARLIPQVSGLGLMRVAVLVSANPGCEDRVTLALKVPNYWRRVNRCEGMFTHFSVQLVPVKFLKQFRQYIKRLLELGLIAKFSIILTGEYVPNFPNFDCYNPANNEWTFQWGRWLTALNKTPTRTVEDPVSYSIHADKKDILIVRELEKDGRKSFAELAPLLGISLQGVKYHYDKKLVPAGIVKYFGFDVLPYPEEVSAYHEILLNFKNSREMNKFYSLIRELFFVLGVAKVLHQNALLVRTYTLQNHVLSLFTFLSEMAQEGRIESYSAIRQNFVARRAQTIPYELYDRETGWKFDLKKYKAELSKLARTTTIRRRA
jgi:DNA-binding Lrp family transcriptional regulator